jgi:hypothetical protein
MLVSLTLTLLHKLMTLLMTDALRKAENTIDEVYESAV